MSTPAVRRSEQGHWTRMVWVVGVGLPLIVGPAAISSSAALSTAPAAPRCGGEPATVVGTDDSDDLHATPGRDVVVALGGDDFIKIGAGRDLVWAGER